MYEVHCSSYNVCTHTQSIWTMRMGSSLRVVEWVCLEPMLERQGSQLISTDSTSSLFDQRVKTAPSVGLTSSLRTTPSCSTTWVTLSTVFSCLSKTTSAGELVFACSHVTTINQSLSFIVQHYSSHGSHWWRPWVRCYGYSGTSWISELSGEHQVSLYWAFTICKYAYTVAQNLVSFYSTHLLCYSGS